MDETTQGDWLDRQLRDAAPYIDDDGFTARVLKRLPAPRQRRQSLRVTILVGITLLSSALAYLLSGGGRFVTLGVARLTAWPTLWLFALALGSGILVMAVGLIAALSKASEV
jgi:hypothetical protein